MCSHPNRGVLTVFPPLSYRAKYTHIHDGSPLVRGSDLVEDHVPLPVSSPPKLIIVSIDAEKALLSTSKASNDFLRRFVNKLLLTLHPSGTIACGVPRPWLEQGPRIRGTSAPRLLQYLYLSASFSMSVVSIN